MVEEALSKMADAASTLELKKVFQKHLDETKDQAHILEDIFEELDEEPKEEKCLGLEGIIKEGEQIIKMDAEPFVRDAALIAAAQKVEHYEMAAYGTLRTYAKMLGLEDSAMRLQEVLHQETRADQQLSMLAENLVNPEAAEVS